MTTPWDVGSFAHTGTNSGPSIRGTGSSNPFRSANESLSLGLICATRRNSPRRAVPIQTLKITPFGPCSILESALGVEPRSSPWLGDALALCYALCMRTMPETRIGVTAQSRNRTT